MKHIIECSRIDIGMFYIYNFKIFYVPSHWFNYVLCIKSYLLYKDKIKQNINENMLILRKNYFQKFWEIIDIVENDLERREMWITSRRHFLKDMNLKAEPGK